MVNINNWIDKVIVLWFEHTERTIVGILKHYTASLIEIECVDDSGATTTWVVERVSLAAIGLAYVPE